MKSRTWIKALAAPLVIAAIAAGCTLLSVSITDRLALFADDLSSADRSTVYTNFHPTLTTDYDAAKAASYWDALFPTGTYTIYSINAADPAAVTAVMDGPAAFGTGLNAVFKMAKSGEDWMIEEITSIDTYPSSPVVQ